MADELVFSGGEIVYTMPQLPKVTSAPLNGSAVCWLVLGTLPMGRRSSLILTLGLKKATKFDHELAAVSGLPHGRVEYPLGRKTST